MSELLLVTLPEYYKCQVKPRNFQDWTEMYDAQEYGVLGLWELKSFDARTGTVLQRIWAKNIITDNGATSALKNLWNNAGSTVSVMNQIAVSASSGSTTLTTALTNGQTGVTSLAVQAIPAAIASGTVVTIGYGTGQTQNVTLSGSASLGATSLSVTSFTANAAYAIGSNVVPVPLVTDNPSSVTGAQYSGALSSGAFSFSGTGAGNRQVQIQYTFTAGSFTTGNYTDLYTTNANPIASNSTASHLITVPTPLNNVTSLTATIIEKV